MESAHVLPGRRIVTVDTPAGRVGLSICYDLRFPEFYRRLRLRGAEVLVAPSAFTAATGKAHWDLLVRTRAVENACYLVAAAQWGNHGGRRKSFGRAMIVDPWGEVLAVCEDGVGVAVAEVSRRRLERLRGLLDSTGHARLLPRSWYAKGGSPR
jgi:predicted amidohydrolase